MHTNSYTGPRLSDFLLNLNDFINNRNYFSTGQNIYQQTQGVAMGSYHSRQIADLIGNNTTIQRLARVQAGNHNIGLPMVK
jgi:hypothetical protein